jgi:APA family basic amino acid/polyamine antiporter
MNSLLRTKSIEALLKASEEPGRRLEKTLGPWSLTALGVGAVIGSGIFILTGTAAAGEVLSVRSILHAPVLDLLLHGSDAVSTIGRPGAGPAISLSFILVAFVCSLAALCYGDHGGGGGFRERPGRSHCERSTRPPGGASATGDH